MSKKPSAALGAFFVVSLTLLLFLLNGDAKMLTMVWNALGPYVGVIQQMMGYVVIICFGAIAMKSEGIAWRDLGLTKKDLLLASPLFVAFMAGIVLLVWLGGGWSSTFVAVTPGLPLAAVAFSVALVAFAEEYIFRGFVQVGTSRRFGVTSGLLVSAAVFSLVHVPTDLSSFSPSTGLYRIVELLSISAISRFAFGALAFSYMYQLTGNMFVTMFTHAFYDFTLTYLVVAGGTLSIVVLYLFLPYAVILIVYYVLLQGLLGRPVRYVRPTSPGGSSVG
ncbi:MAG: CPBP family intramembrane glutamic endopeptidase [Conexivisphaerales archaeon]